MAAFGSSGGNGLPNNGAYSTILAIDPKNLIGSSPRLHNSCS